MVERRDYVALDWVAGEIGETLKQAAQALEAYVANRDDATKLRFCLTHIHQVHGTLQMVEFFGAALLAEEMEKLAQALSNSQIHESHIDDALLVLKTALVQLPLYLERVKESRHGLPATLLPVLNDLRAVRGESLLSETVLFAPDIAAVQGSGAAAVMQGAELAEVAHKLRQMYQIALLGFIRGRDTRKNLNYLAKVCARLVKLCAGQPSQSLWRVCIAVLEGLLNGSIETGVSVKILLRQVDRQIKHIIDNGERALAQPCPEDLLKNLLYYVARSQATSKYIVEIKNEFSLANSLLGDGNLDDTELAAPDSHAMQTVYAALAKELADIRSVMIAAEGDVSALTEALPLFRRVSDTMAILGIGSSLKQLQQQHSRLASCLATQQLTAAELNEIIEQLAHIESQLSVSDVDIASNEAELFNDSEEAQQHLDDAFDSVVRESRNGLEQAKDAIIEFVATQWDHNCLTDVPDTLAAIHGSLAMVPMSRAAQILVSCERYIRESLLAEQTVPEWQMLDTLADAITSIDYYLERLADDSDNDGDSILDAAAESVAELGYPVEAELADQSVPTLEDRSEPADESLGDSIPVLTDETDTAQQSHSQDDTQQNQEPQTDGLESSSEPDVSQLLDNQEIPVLVEELPSQEIEQPPVHQEDIDTAPELTDSNEVADTEAALEADDEFDPEIVEIFIEEAEEVLETIAEYLPQWRSDNSNTEARDTLRRAYHTLKGSGRMVGANAIGDLAWSIENLLNRVLEGSLTIDEPRFELIEAVTAYIPTMVKAFESRRPLDGAVAEAMIAKAEAFTNNQNPSFENPTSDESDEEIIALEDGGGANDTEVEEVELGSESSATDFEILVDHDESDADVDQELLSIFAVETALHLEVLEDYIQHCHELAAPAMLTDELQRALHTLKGSANMAAVTPVAMVVSPLENMIKDLRASQLKADGAVVDLLEQAAQFIKAGIDQLETTPMQLLPGVDDFLERLIKLHKERMALAVHSDDESSIAPEALNKFLTNSLDIITDASEQLVAWQQTPLSSVQRELLVGSFGKLIDSAEAVNMAALADFGEAVHVLYRQAAAFELPAKDFFVLAEDANDALIDMLDQIAGHQNPVYDTDIFNRIEEFEFTDIALEDDAEEAALLNSQNEQQPDSAVETLASEPSSAMISETDFDAAPAVLAELVDVVSPDDGEDEDDPSLDDYDTDNSFYVDVGLNDGGAASTNLGTAETDDAEADVVEADGLELDADEAYVNEAYVSEAEVIEAGGLELDAAEADVAEVDDLEPDAAEADVTEVDALGLDAAEADVTEVDDLELDAAEADVAEVDDLELDAAEAEAEAEADALELDATKDDSSANSGSEFGLSEPSSALAIDDNDAQDPVALEPTFEPTPSAIAAGSDDDEDDIDAEIIEIFIEEADELLEDLDEAIHNWGDDYANRAHLDDLLRILHTIKGGARLAGLTAIGDLSHDFETMLERVDIATVDAELLADVQRYQDQLLSVLEQIKAGGEPAAIADDSVLAPAQSSTDSEDAVVTIEENSQHNVADELPEQPNSITEPVVSVPSVAQQAPIESGDKAVVPFAPPKSSDDTAPTVKVAQDNKKGPQEVVKVSANLLEELVNLAGETSISRGRTEEQVSELVFSLDEMQITVDRLQEQVRRLDMETEQQILYRQEQVESEGLEGFDPLEMDRYSQLQQLSRSLLESSSDLIDIKSTLSDKSRDMETLLIQQSRINTELQEGLMRSRMVPFSRMVPRLRRIVRQISGELDKKVEFRLDNVEGELDRTVLERMVAPLEHMLRNAVDHGIESREQRAQTSKPEHGTVSLNLSREGGEIVLTLTDDGAGINLDVIKAKALERGLMEAGASLSDQEVLQFILQSGFSTADKVTQISGRGVGMDVVHSEIKQLGGTMEIESVYGQGTRFIVRLPFTVSVNRALMVSVGGDRYAIPLNSIEGIVRVSPFELEAYYQPDAPMFEYAGQPYLMRYMGALLNRGEKPNLDGLSMPLPVVLVRGADHSVAVQVDSLMGSREIVVKPLGPQFSMVQGLSGATVLGDGSVVVILDLMAMIRADATHLHRDVLGGNDQPQIQQQKSTLVMVVDDSVTVRKVTSRFLERQGMEVLLAKDGVDAVTQLNELERLPDVMLLDIEMPRMDGFEVASRVKHSDRLKSIPIIMITSRTGEKHYERAMSLGVNRYMGKPYQESELLEGIFELIGETAR